jgi:hypothetical protein
MQHDEASPSILRVTAVTGLPSLGIAPGKTAYLVPDALLQGFCLVWWDRIHWRCSCKWSGCGHRLAVNDFVFEASQQRQITGDGLALHIEDDLCS